jgi:hypothetical protein
MAVIDALRAKILQDNYELTGHTFEEAREDEVSLVDIENVILYGEIVKAFSHDRRGKRYLIEGHGLDKRLLHVVCRILASGKLRIITVYAM